MLSTAKSANVEFWQVVQLFAPPTNPASARAENSFYKFEKKIFVCQQCAHKYYGLVGLGLGFRVRVSIRVSLV